MIPPERPFSVGVRDEITLAVRRVNRSSVVTTLGSTALAAVIATASYLVTGSGFLAGVLLCTTSKHVGDWLRERVHRRSS